jgi:hypothetical protein
MGGALVPMNLDALTDWTPLRLFARDGGMFVDWAHLGQNRFLEPFFDQTIAKCLRHPADALFRHQTPIEVLRDLYEQRRGLKPSGFIFHMSRCGSTLVSQMLASIERCIAISEARPIDEVLTAEVSEEQRGEWLRWIVHALGLPHHGEDSFFVKFDAWHVTDLPFITRVFPETPWIFLFRDPVEVLVSQTRERGVQVMPTGVAPTRFGLSVAEPWFTKLDEYAARVLGRLCEAALEHHNVGQGRLVNFKELPNAMPKLLERHFKVPLSAGEIQKLLNTAQFDAKRPSLNFENDSITKQRAASDELKQLAAQFMQPAYEELERERLKQRVV